MSAPVAHARPSVALSDGAARAGDAVHFSITGVEGWGVAYHLEIGDEDVLDGRVGGDVSNAFTMPDLGEEAKTVLLDAEIWWSDRQRTVKLRLEYLGRALPAPDPLAQLLPSTVADPAPQAASSPQVTSSPAAAGGTSTPQATKSEPQRRRLHSPKRRASADGQRAARDRDRGRAAHRSGGRRPHWVTKHRRSKRRYRRMTGFYRGYAEPGAPRTAGREGALVLNAIAPHTAGLAAAAARPSTGVSIALVVPALLALASLALAGTALHRRRRLGARG